MSKSLTQNSPKALKKSLSALVFNWWGSVGEARTFINEVRKLNIETLRAAVDFLAA